MAEQPPRLVKRPRVKKADKIAHLVEQHERYMRRDRSSPVWVRVKVYVVPEVHKVFTRSRGFV